MVMVSHLMSNGLLERCLHNACTVSCSTRRVHSHFWRAFLFDVQIKSSVKLGHSPAKSEEYFVEFVHLFHFFTRFEHCKLFQLSLNFFARQLRHWFARQRGR